MKICDIMSDRVISIGMDEPVSAAARLLKNHNIGSVPVCSGDGKLRGIVTDRDIVLRCVAADADPNTTPVKEIMSRGILTAQPFDDAEKAAELMSQDQVRRLPVLDNGRLVGIVALSDLARNCNCEMEAASALTEISSNLRRR
ncbi:MAG: CBS domain-containing protein [Oscillospiraceae bacterium]|nr:CBS domain-containing protein [Oscillospiraceae bacterium]